LALRFEQLSPEHDTDSFRSGAAYLDWALQHNALALQEANVSRTYVLVASGGQEGKKPIEGYITLEAGLAPTAFLSLLPEDALSQLIRSESTTRPGISPLAELPVVYLAYLARHERNQGKGYGDLLLVEVLRRAARVGSEVGAAGIYLVATMEGMRLYEEYGFRAYGDYPQKMFLSFSEIRKALEPLEPWYHGSRNLSPR